MAGPNDNGYLEQMVTRLSDYLGIPVAVKGASNNRLLSYLAILQEALIERLEGLGTGGTGGPAVDDTARDSAAQAQREVDALETVVDGKAAQGSVDGLSSRVDALPEPVPGDSPVFVQSAQPTFDGPYFWVKLSAGGNAEFYYDDGL